jgi:hypothetical protein
MTRYAGKWWGDVENGIIPEYSGRKNNKKALQSQGRVL